MEGVKNESMAEHLTPSQKQLLEDSYGAFNASKNRTTIHNATNSIKSNNMLHRTDDEYLESILNNGLQSREFTGVSTASHADVTVPGTRTPMSVDVWDVTANMSIGDYFAGETVNVYGHRVIKNSKRNWATGESNFMSPSGNFDRKGVIIVFDKQSVDPTIMNNSFKVSEGTSPMFMDGNMSGYTEYTSHRAVPVGLPSNSIEKIIIPNGASASDIKHYQQLIKNSGLDIKMYDINGNLLFDPSKAKKSWFSF